MLHIWATLLSFLVLEINVCGECLYRATGTTSAGVIASTCLCVLPLDKAIWVILIGVFGGPNFRGADTCLSF